MALVVQKYGGTSVANIERIKKYITETVDIATDEASFNTNFPGDVASGLNGLFGEIYPVYDSPLPSPREGIQPKMALKMKEFFALHIPKFPKLDVT